MARRIIRDEGLLVGGSSGATMWAAIQVAKTLPADKRVVVIFVDSVRNYISKFLNDDWLLENDFISQEQYDELNTSSYNKKEIYGDNKLINELELTFYKPLTLEISCHDAIESLKAQGTECVCF